MQMVWRGVLVLAGSLLLLLVLAWGGLYWWLGSDDLRVRTQAQLSAALGVEVRLGGMVVDVWPVPAVALRQVQILTQPALRIERLELRPAWRALLRRELVVTTAVVHQADLSQAGVAQLLDAMARLPASPDAPVVEVGLPRHVVLDRLAWQPSEGQGLVVDADLRLDEGGVPTQGTLQVRGGWMQGAQLDVSLERANSWRLQGKLAGGTLQGSVAIAQMPAQGVPLRMEGSVETRGVDLAALARVMGRSATLHGKLQASTTWQVQAKGWGGAVAALRSQSRFTVQDGVLQGLDLVRAVRTVGLNRGGETRLDQLTGQLTTQGRSLQLGQLEARSGLLHATGAVAVSARRTLSGRVVVSLTPAVLSPVMGVPLELGGTLDAPTATLTRSAMIGATIGTAVLPGVGTGAGAALGDRVGDAVKGLFGR